MEDNHPEICWSDRNLYKACFYDSNESLAFVFALDKYAWYVRGGCDTAV